jgi:HupE / UreJ protein
LSRRAPWCWLLTLWLLLATGGAVAHKPSDSYLTLAADGAVLTGRWDIALRDLDLALGLDTDGDGRITWGEVRSRHADIAALAQANLVLRADGQPCNMAVGPQQVDEHTDGAYSVLPLTVTCPRAPAVLDIGYTLFADLDPQHRGLLSLAANGATRAAILGPQASQQAFALAEVSRWRQFVDYFADGVWHIWIGFDHILFLLSLLLPAVGTWAAAAGGRAAWQPVPRAGVAVWEVLRIVTAFTVAHSITLSLATLGWVDLPSRLVEATIAASVVLAALNNVWPFFQGRRWMVAFGFGLIHGFGFASVLADLGLPRDALLLALVGFNLGVEAGQLAIVAAFLPWAYALRRGVFYRRVVLWGGSLAIAAIAAAWFVERALDLEFMPF